MQSIFTQPGQCYAMVLWPGRPGWAAVQTAPCSAIGAGQRNDTDTSLFIHIRIISFIYSIPALLGGGVDRSLRSLGPAPSSQTATRTSLTTATRTSLSPRRRQAGPARRPRGRLLAQPWAGAVLAVRGADGDSDDWNSSTRPVALRFSDISSLSGDSDDSDSSTEPKTSESPVAVSSASNRGSQAGGPASVAHPALIERGAAPATGSGSAPCRRLCRKDSGLSAGSWASGKSRTRHP